MEGAMTKNAKKSPCCWRIFLLTLSLLLFSGSPAWGEEFKAAMLIPGVITDKSASQSGYEGMVLAEKELGIEIAYSEKVAQPDQAEALADYARRGYNLVIGHGGEFQDAVNRVAQRYPDTMFLVSNGSTPGANVAVVRFHFEALAYTLGYIGGKMTKSNKCAFIGAQQIAYSLQQLTGFSNGFKAADPNGQVLTAWTNDWDDIAKGKEAALSVISQGADVVFPTMDNAILGSFQAAKEQGKWSFGIYYDTYPAWPDTILQSAIMKWSRVIADMIKIAKEGKLEFKQYIVGFESPAAVGLGTYNPAVPEEVRKEVAQVIEDIKSGKINPGAKQ